LDADLDLNFAARSAHSRRLAAINPAPGRGRAPLETAPVFGAHLGIGEDADDGAPDGRRLPYCLMWLTPSLADSGIGGGGVRTPVPLMPMPSRRPSSWVPTM
jgi:hypothetical protein